MRATILNSLRLVSLLVLTNCGYPAEPLDTFLPGTDRRALNGGFGITIGKEIPADCEIISYEKQPGGYLRVMVVPPNPDPLFITYCVSVASTECLAFNIAAATEQPEKVRIAMLMRFGKPDGKFDGFTAWTNSTRRMLFGENRDDPAHRQWLLSCGDRKLCDFLSAVDEYAEHHPRQSDDKTPDPMIARFARRKAQQTKPASSGSSRYVNNIFGIKLGESLPRDCVIRDVSTNALKREITAQITPPLPHPFFTEYAVTMGESNRLIYHLVARTETPKSTLQALIEQWGEPNKEIDNWRQFRKFVSWDTRPGFITYRISDEGYGYLTCTDFGLMDRLGAQPKEKAEPTAQALALAGDSSPDRIPQTRPESFGSGFFITDDGFLITNEHVVRDSTQIRVVSDEGLLNVKVVKVDAANDLALLKVEGRFAPLPIAASRTVRLGSTVATVGFLLRSIVHRHRIR